MKPTPMSLRLPGRGLLAVLRSQGWLTKEAAATEATAAFPSACEKEALCTYFSSMSET
ncbi:MAG: hypothetical protein M3256_26265 [Actinomycetota bacterium]|nr:hypothetical protein [Actinomycetota bacterium]